MKQVAIWIAVVLLWPSGRLGAQDAETLYGARAWRAAADSFAARAVTDPSAPANWYNLGNSLYRLGDDPAARAAWIRAARALPRDGDVRQALTLVQAPDPVSADATQVPIVTPGEVLAIAVLLWLTGWMLVILKRSLKLILPLLLASVILAIFGVSKAQEFRLALALVRHPNTAMRAAPFASASARRTLTDGATVEVIRGYAGWVLVRRGSDQGWLQKTEIVPLTGNTS